MLKIIFYSLMPLMIVIGIPCFSQTYYVSATGNDSHSKIQAQNTATPWKTIQHACNSSTPGTTIQIMAGTYFEQDTVSVSGSASGGYITLTNYNGGAVVINGNAAAVQLLTISSKSYIRINGLEFYNCIGNNNSIGLFIDGVSDHISITNNKIHHIYWSTSFAAVPNTNDNVNPLIVYGDSSIAINNLTIEGNSFYDNAPGFSEVCSVNGNVDTFNIINNLVYNNQNIGIDMEGNEGVSPNPATDHARNGLVKGNKVWKCHSVYDSSAAGIYVDGGSAITIEQNESYTNDWGIEIGCEIPGDTTSEIKVRDNILFRNGGGMQMGGYDGPSNTGRVINSEFSNNTFFANDTLEQGNGELSLSYSEHCSFYNNIFYSKATTLLSSGWNSGNSIGLQLDYNRYFTIHGDSLNSAFSYGTFSYTGFTNYKAGSGFDAHSIFSNPSLTDTSLSSLNFHLSPSSTCINNGMPGWPADTSEHDFYGAPRIVGFKIDIGASEYQSPAGIKAFNAIQSVKVYPNPGKGEFVLVSSFVNTGATIVVYSILGEKIYSGKLNSDLDLRDNASGLYMYKGFTDTGELIFSGRLIIQK